MNAKIMNARIVSGFFLCVCHKGKASRCKVKKKVQAVGVITVALWLAFFSCGLISHPIGHHTIKMSKSNQCPQFLDLYRKMPLNTVFYIAQAFSLQDYLSKQPGQFHTHYTGSVMENLK